jgi:subtilisin family serine protease
MTFNQTNGTLRRKAVWGPKRTLIAAAVLLVGLSGTAGAAPGGSGGNSSRHQRQAPVANPGAPSARVKNYKVDDVVEQRKKSNPLFTSRVIVTLNPGAQLPPQFKKYLHGGNLDIIGGVVLDLPNGLIKQLESQPEIFRIHDDRPTQAHNFRTSVTVGATAVRSTFGYMGDGVGIAVIDSGVTAWHDDLSRGSVYKTFPYGNQRVAKFVDFVAAHTLPYDDNGHGTHVAGIIAGNGYDSAGEKAGIAPNASIVSLKVLDGNGQGSISNVIAALNWVAANYQTYNYRVVNLSVGAPIRESYWTDPLTLACKRVAELGITVVTAAGNRGKDATGQLMYGGITAPGNAPWVLTVGASSTQGTPTRADDVMADYSSSGPTAVDFAAKPDLVAPGTGTVSLLSPGSLFAATKLTSLISGSGLSPNKPYLALSGTSMAAPVVSGTVALMLQANPSLTPNLIKAILQYTAQPYPGYNPLREGAGFLNTYGAVRLAKFYADNRAGTRMPLQTTWGRTVIWGNHRLSGGYLSPRGNAWASNIVWGTAKTVNGLNIVWGTNCGSGCDNIVWGTHDANGDNIVWGTGGNDNIVWGTGGSDNIVWGTMSRLDNIVWGTGGGDNIVWGTDCGGGDCDNIVWGTTDGDNIVWGTADRLDNIVWGTNGVDNIVWGTNGGDNIVWGTSDDLIGDPVFPDNTAADPLPDPAVEFGDTVPVNSSTVGGL